jgi:hypothetical protein
METRGDPVPLGRPRKAPQKRLEAVPVPIQND